MARPVPAGILQDTASAARGLKGLKLDANKFITRSVIEADYKVLQLFWSPLPFRVVFSTVCFDLRQPRRALNPHKLVVSGIDHLDAASGHVRAFISLYAAKENSRFLIAIVAFDIERQFTFPLQQSREAWPSSQRR